VSTDTPERALPATTDAALATRALREGAGEFMPAALGVGAWGLVTGVAMVQSGLPLWAALAMSLIVFAGSAQLAALPLIIAGAPLWLVTLTALVVNLRFIIYSAALRQSLQHLPAGRRVLLGYLVGDVPTAIYLQRLRHAPGWPGSGDYLLGLSAANALVWHVSSLIGIFAASSLPRDWGLEFAGSLAVLALLVPACRTRPGLAGAVVAGTVAVLGHGWPLRTGVLAGMAAGIGAAFIVQSSLGARRAAAT
jgi:predicted branched-subunit amino acid permease